MKTAENRGFLPEQWSTVRAEKAFSCSWFESRYPSSKKGRIPRRDHPSPTLRIEGRNGLCDQKRTKNPVQGVDVVPLCRLIRTYPDTSGLFTAWVVHLLGMDATQTTSPTFLTQHELAEMLRLPERTLEDWRLTRVGPPYLKLGRHVRYDIQDVLAWVREHRHG